MIDPNISCRPQNTVANFLRCVQPEEWKLSELTAAILRGYHYWLPVDQTDVR